MEYYIEYGGGLGDIFNGIFSGKGYRGLKNLGEADHATVALITHNPYAHELFDWHPNAAMMTVRQLPYWQPQEVEVNRLTYNLPQYQRQPAANGASVEFYAPVSDQAILEQLRRRPYLAVAASAGRPERSIPEWILHDLLQQLSWVGITIVFLGRTYERAGRAEYRPPVRRGVVDLINRLSVPGTAIAVEGASAIVTCHSAISILAWHLRRPQLLLYPASVVERHFRHVPRDDWSFGLDWDLTSHELFATYSGATVKRFLRMLRNHPKSPVVA